MMKFGVLYTKLFIHQVNFDIEKINGGTHLAIEELTLS